MRRSSEFGVRGRTWEMTKAKVPRGGVPEHDALARREPRARDRLAKPERVRRMAPLKMFSNPFAL